MTVDLTFPVQGNSIPTDHSYPLYAALSRLVPAFHDPAAEVRFAPLTGSPGEPGRLRLNEWSHLRVRLPDDAIRTALPLAGKRLDVAGAAVRLGPPTVQPLVPSTTVESWLVTFKHGEEPDAFLTTVRAKLTEIEVTGEPAVRAFESGLRAGEPRRRVVRLRGQKIVGYALLVSGLTAEESIRLQERGLGGRTRMGCGFFLPVREDKS
jgi:CRISPR-associated protein Cas6